MAGRPLFALLALIILAGGIVLNVFIILSGVITTTPMPHIYFLEARTTGIGSSPATAAWTYFALCTETDGLTSACSRVSPAPPFDPVRNFGTTDGVPQEFISNGNYYYYLSRVSWAFYLIALFFAACALFTGLLALCTRLGAVLSGVNAFMAMASQAVAASLMTAWTVKARNAFRNANINSNLGMYAYGFSWAIFACYFIAMILFCCGGGGRKKEQPVEEDVEATETGTTTNEPGTGYFGRDASQARSTGVKDEYS